MTLRLLTAGESHGERLTVILDGVPAGLTVREEDLARDLTRRQGGHGRGGRMAIEHDEAHIVAGVRGGLTLGSPITLEIANRDWENWRQVMAVDAAEVKRKPITRVRPGQPPFMQRNVSKGAPDWVRTVPVWSEGSHREIAQVLEAQGAWSLLDAMPVTLCGSENRSPYATDGDYFTKPSREDVIEAVYHIMHERVPSRFPSID